MKIIKTALIIIVYLSIIKVSYSTVYYISNYGEDTNNGISPVYPIRTITKLNSLIFKLQPGDVVLFERDGIYYGQINLNASGNEFQPIIFGAYGTGRDPIISGSVRADNWESVKGNIYSTFVNSEVKDLFYNNKRMILARYPNSGYLRVDRPNPNPLNGFTDSELKQPNGYWKGSNVRIRTENWAYEHTQVQEFKNGILFYSKPTYYSAKEGWGYYLDNNINQMDISGEWFYDINNKNNSENLYFVFPNGADPNSSDIRATITDCGIFSLMEMTNLILQDIEFRDQYMSGIYFAKKLSKLIIDNCTFRGQNQMGVYVPGKSENVRVNNCRFYDITGKAFYLLNSNNSSLSNSIFQDIGMIEGYGTTGDAFPMSAVLLFGNNNNISGNYISNIGHNGINCMGSGNTISRNIVKNCLLLLNDGGAFKCYGENSSSSVWNKNFAYNVLGNIESTNTEGNQIIALGVYLDELANKMKVSHNTISGCGFASIGTNAGFENLFEYNNCYDNAVGLTFYQNKILCKNNTTKNNILFSNKENQIAVLNQSLYRSNIPGLFDNNLYANPSEYNIFRIMENNIIYDFNFDKWKNFVRSDNSSSIFIKKEAKYSKLCVNMTDDSITLLLKPEATYTNLNQESIHSFITLLPWSSEILMSNSVIDDQPEISISGGSLKFDEKERTEIPLWYSVSGTNLQSNITINPPEGFEVSLKSDYGFTKSLSLTPESGKLDKIIFVRFVPDDKRGYYGFISVNSGYSENKVRVSANSR